MSFPSFTCNFVGVSIDTRRRFRRLELDDLSPPWSSFSRLLLLSDSAFPMDGLSPCSHCMTVCTVMHAFSLEPSSCRFHRNLTPAYLSSSMEYGRDSTYRRARSWSVLPRSAFQATTSSHSRPSIIPAPVSATQRFEVLAISSLSLNCYSP
jgi:hypothetical protein